jgi:hypothetical protein
VSKHSYPTHKAKTIYNNGDSSDAWGSDLKWAIFCADPTLSTSEARTYQRPALDEHTGKEDTG